MNVLQRLGIALITAAFAPRITAPIRHAQRHRRNKPCPCGSGLKFKRCCHPSHHISQVGQTLARRPVTLAA